MMLPPAMNARYAGPAWLPVVLAVLGVGELIPSLIHSFAPDGGAFSIAGLGNAAGRAQIIALFAWAGATQLVWAMIILAVAIRYRVFVSAILMLMLIEKICIALNGWVLKGTSAPHHPPALYAVLFIIPALALLLTINVQRESRA